jgi:acyl-coenzyme A synthetase/AMP-(fatty) acid ligase
VFRDAAPTAIRALQRHGDEPPRKHDLSTLRVLGTVGEPINPEAWLWYHEGMEYRLLWNDHACQLR